jgi:nuclear transport factor 2 (NTF2) superfamily protein
VAFENADFRDMVNVEKRARDLRRAHTSFLTILSCRYLLEFKDAHGRWLRERDNERRRKDMHTLLPLNDTSIHSSPLKSLNGVNRTREYLRVSDNP